VPSRRHQILVELFRNCGELAPELLRTCAGITLDHDHVEPGSIDLSQVVSTEYRADAVVELRARDGAVVAAVIVEVQLRSDAAKPYSWPVYVTALRAEHRCPVVLLVVTTKRSVARWARRPIEIGHPGFCLLPVVLSFQDLPRIIDLPSARRLPELAVLSAMAHPALEVASTAVEAISVLPEDQNRLYLDVILATLPDAIRQILEARMQGYKYQSEFARRYYNQGRSEGRTKGREEGFRSAVLALARTKLETITPEDEAAIKALHDKRALTELVGALGQARSAAKARAALTLVLARSRDK
jgi:hypothetical protein